MKIIYVLLLALALAGCNDKTHIDLGQAPPAEMPVLPENLKKKAGRLPDITDPSLTGAYIDGVLVDRQYNEVAIQLNTIIEVWECVRVSLKDKKSPDACFEGVVN